MADNVLAGQQFLTQGMLDKVTSTQSQVNDIQTKIDGGDTSDATALQLQAALQAHNAAVTEASNASKTAFDTLSAVLKNFTI